MANVVLTQLPRGPQSLAQFIFSDIHLDLETAYTVNDQLHKTAERTDLRVDYDINAVRNSLRNLFLTSPGEKILTPEYGLDLRYFIFEPITETNAEQLASIIRSQISIYEPRVTINQIKVIMDDEEHRYGIILNYSIPSLNIQNVYLNGVLNNNGYTFI